MKKIAKSFKKYLLISFGALIISVIGSSFVSSAFAQAPPPSSDCGSACCGDPSVKEGSPCVDKGQLDKFAQDATKANDAKKINCPNKQDCGGIVTKVLNPLINTMTAIVGIIVTISVVVGAVTYSAAGGDPGKVSAAKKRITNSIIALIAYIFVFGLLQWLVPGGLI